MSETPSKRKRVTYEDAEVDPAFETPTKKRGSRVVRSKSLVGHESSVENVPVVNADRSARRKSARRLIERSAQSLVNDSENEDDEDDLAERILEDDYGHDSETDQTELENTALETPTKRGRPRKKKVKERTPSPPRDLPPHEQYFYDNRPGGKKTSNSTLASISLLSHDVFFDRIKAYQDPHQPELDFLYSIHSRSFDQWCFELDQGFNLCLYGWGSKHGLLLDFAEHLNAEAEDETIIVINGYNPAITLRDILNTVASVIPELSIPSRKLGAQPAEMLQTILKALERHTRQRSIKLLVHCIDAASLRRPQVQSALARLAACPAIQIIASVDTRTFPILWDATLSTQFNWLFHDTTTFKPFDLEISGGMGIAGVVDEVNSLFGRTGRKMQGREGVMYVLRSLTENARNLYALLVAELLSVDDIEDAVMSGDDDFDDGRGRNSVARNMKIGIDFRTLYQKAASQFIATNEPTFRALLREFYDHEMLVSRKDALGGEVFAVPFRKEEMQNILEELMV